MEAGHQLSALGSAPSRNGQLKRRLEFRADFAESLRLLAFLISAFFVFGSFVLAVEQNENRFVQNEFLFSARGLHANSLPGGRPRQSS